MMLTLTEEEERDIIVLRLQRLLDVPRLQARFIELFTSARDGLVTPTLFAQRIYDAAPAFDSDNLLKSMACRVRPVLARALEIKKADVFTTLYGKGYRMDAEYVAAILEKVGVQSLKPSERTP